MNTSNPFNIVFQVWLDGEFIKDVTNDYQIIGLMHSKELYVFVEKDTGRHFDGYGAYLRYHHLRKHIIHPIAH